MPLDVDRGIELPQLELTHNFTGDCTTAYSTGSESWKTMMMMMRMSWAPQILVKVLNMEDNDDENSIYIVQVLKYGTQR